MAIDDGGVIQRARVDSLRGRPALLSEADIRSASRAETEVQPAPGIIDRSIQRKGAAGQFKVRLLPFRDHGECRAGAPLTPLTMTDDDNIRVAGHLVSDVAAYAAAFVYVAIYHYLPRSVG